MAEMARDLSRSMSRQLSSVMERTGRALRNDGAASSARMPRAVAPRGPLPAEVAAQVESLPYRRSRARMLARKWRLSRKQANPIIVALVIMVCAASALAVTFGGAFGGVYGYNYYQSHRAQIRAIAAEKNHASSEILDRNGTVLATIKDDNGFKIYLSIDQISPKLQWATIDTEDRTFYSNIGIDFIGTLRSALTDLAHGGAAVQGGSTITQQLVKLIVAKDSTKTYVRKINEAILAYGVTQEYNKAQILEMYLNTISYGDSNTGIEAAARNYFRIQPKGDGTTANLQLTWAQSAILAGVPNAPTVYQPDVYSCKKAPCTMAQWDDPYVQGQTCGTLIPTFYDYGDEWYLTHGHEWLVYCRALKVLDNLHRYGVGDNSATFTDADYAQAKADVQKILENQQVYSWQDAPANSGSSSAPTTKLAPNFVDYVQGILNDWGYTDLGNAGIRVYTTLDYNLQKYAETDLDYYINQTHKEPWYCRCDNEPPIAQQSNGNDGALIAIDQHTGDIMAMVGSVNYNSKDPRVAGNVNITIAPRSMGSATKPLVYATDLQMGWTPGTMLQDVPICFPDPNYVDNDPTKPVQDDVAKACKGWYVPHNYDDLNFSGRFPLRYVWGNSLNVPATEGLAFAGWNPAHSQNFISMANRLGVYSLKPNSMGPTTALGTQDIPMIQLASAYGTFGNQGKRVPPRAILRIEDNTGNQIYPVPPGPPIAPPPAGQQVISPETAYMVTSVLTDNIARARDFGYAPNPLHFSPPTVDGTNYPDFEFAAKTGTSSGVVAGPRDIVTFGYSNYLTLGVWMGNANSADMAQGIIGIAGAGYVFHDVMLYGIQHMGWNTNSHFPVPSDLGRTYFNCTTGLAPYKGTKIGDTSDPNFNCPFAPWDPKYNANLYNHDQGGDSNHSPDADWYIKTQPWLQS